MADEEQIYREKQINRVIEFLSKCGNAEIQTGIDALKDSGSKEKFAEFRAGLAKAMGPAVSGG